MVQTATPSPSQQQEHPHMPPPPLPFPKDCKACSGAQHMMDMYARQASLLQGKQQRNVQEHPNNSNNSNNSNKAKALAARVVAHTSTIIISSSSSSSSNISSQRRQVRVVQGPPFTGPTGASVRLTHKSLVEPRGPSSTPWQPTIQRHHHARSRRSCETC